jgi:hypothetical protein
MAIAQAGFAIDPGAAHRPAFIRRRAPAPVFRAMRIFVTVDIRIWY